MKFVVVQWKWNYRNKTIGMERFGGQIMFDHDSLDDRIWTVLFWTNTLERAVELAKVMEETWQKEQSKEPRRIT